MRSLRAAPALAAILLAATLLVGGLTPAASAAPGSTGTYTNPISADVGDTFADPVIVRGRDGFWYAYATSDPLREGERVPHRIPTARSSDLVDWAYVGDAFRADQLPTYAAPGASLWAPDVRYLDGRWVMYFTVTDTTVSADTFDTAIGAATAPSPTGPWTFATQPVVAPRPGAGGGYLWTIDPAQFTDVDGTRYLYYGSYYGGLWATELSADGLTAAGTATMVAIDNKFEGSFVVRHERWYYLFASSANCCAGPTTGYSVSVGRSRSPRGPFVDRDGLRLDVSRAGGTPVIAPNGNKWIGTGHNGFLTDLAGQDWLVYHAIDRADPYLDEPVFRTGDINERPMLLDRLDWIDGWPTVRAGAWASEGPTAAPVTGTPVFDRFSGGSLSASWRVAAGSWTVTGGHLRGSGTLLARKHLGGALRVEADLRGDATGLVVGQTTVRLAGDRLVATFHDRVLASTPLPASFDAADWHNLAVEARGGRLTVELSDARLGDQLAVLVTRAPGAAGTVGVSATGVSDVDNFSAGSLHRPVQHAVAEPRAGRPLAAYSDEFSGGLDADWRWVRENPAVTVDGGTLNWPVEGTDLTGNSDNAGVLLRDAPAGAWIAETKLTLDLGEDTVRNFQQAGLIAYVDDDDFARLSAVAIWNTRQVEFGREIPYRTTDPEDSDTAFGGNIAGTPGRTTTWLRLAHRIDPANGEHEYRAGVSRDGRTWTWGGVWTFPAGETPSIGLVAHGGAEPPVVARFDYLRFSAYERS